MRAQTIQSARDVKAHFRAREKIMIGKVLVAMAIVTVAGAPAFAATEYWVGQDASTYKCSVVSMKPDGKKMMDAGHKMFADKAAAEKAIKSMSSCK